MKEHFVNTIYYQIELTARYCKILGQQVFEKYVSNLSLEEYTILDTLMLKQDLCQRDLAKLILKDRANTGKLLDTLEKKGFITRRLAIKNNRPVKIIDITELGVNIANDAAQKIKPHYKQLMEKVNNSDIRKVGDLLKDLRCVLHDTVSIQI